MEIFRVPLILACILIPLLYILNYFGLLVTRAGFTLFRADISLPTRWEGKFAGTTGFERRNFVIFRAYHALIMEIESNSGTVDFQVKAPDGSVLSPVSGTYGQDTRVLFDVGQLKRCSVVLSMNQFNGQFRITLQ